MQVRSLPFPDNSIDMIFTDPPYIKRLVHTYQWLAEEAARVLKPGKFLAAMCGGMALDKIFAWFDAAGLDFYWLYQIQMSGKSAGIIWKDGNPKIPIASRIKHVLVYSKGRAVARTATVSPHRTDGPDKAWHPWGQCVDSHRYYIDCFSDPGDLILDPMSGGGTTGQACSLIGRRFVLGDLDPDALKTSRLRLSGQGLPLTDLPLFNGVSHG
jgi:site-specific DNA-methyltransferase (adenine-specific)